MTDIGLVGVGHIGKILLDRLLEADYEMTVFDVDDSQVRAATERGASAAADPAEIGRTADVVVMALPGTPEVETTMEGETAIEGETGLTSTLGEGQLVIDVTTTLPETSIACEELCRERGAGYVEAPVTSAAPRDGFHMMVGGTEENYLAATEYLDVLCDDHVRIGEIGKGMIFKLALQMRYAGHEAVDAEVVEFARDNGVDPALLNEFLEMGISERYLSRDFDQDLEGLGSLAIWHKDVGYARRVAHRDGTALPINAAVHEAYKATVPRVEENEGHASALLKYWELLNNAAERAPRDHS